MVDWVLEYDDVFSLEEDDRGGVTCVEHVNETSDNPPIQQPPRCVLFALHNQIFIMVKEMSDAEVIQKFSSS